MNLLSIVWKSIRQRSLASSLTALSVALGVALMIAVLVINGVVGRIFSQSGSGYDLVVGAQGGSELQLVLSSIYRIGKPYDNLPWRFYEELQDYAGVDQVIPLCFGDTTSEEEGSFPIIGTLPRFFGTNYAPGRSFGIKKGGEILKGTWDAVIGSEVARVNGWDMGSTFKMVHGGVQDHVHDEEFTVTGVLAPTGTPNDRTVYIHLRGFFMLDDHAKPASEAIERNAALFGENIEELRIQYADLLKKEEAAKKSGQHVHHHDGIPDIQKEVTALLVLTKAPTASIFLTSKLKEGVIAQAVNPVFVMQQLMQNLVGNVRYALMVLTGLIIVVSGIGIFVSIYNSMSDRKREIAIMRALGASRQQVFSIILLESVVLTVGGGLLGLLLGHGLVFAAAPIVTARSGLLINPMHFETIELWILPALLAMAIVIGILPGQTAYRTDVAKALYD
ncbi:MAG: ABC transporter permease [Planctomycetaceae bacterium]|nr:ABC transporter permease [Planctomycetaceae bacterium]